VRCKFESSTLPMVASRVCNWSPVADTSTVSVIPPTSKLNINQGRLSDFNSNVGHQDCRKPLPETMML